MNSSYSEQSTWVYLCSQCQREEDRQEEPTLGGNECPECGCGMTAIGEKRGEF